MRDVNRGVRLGIVALLGAAALCGCAVATPQQSQLAEGECFDEARHEGYRQLELVGIPVVVGDVVIAEIKAQRHGEAFSGSCNYDQRRRHATLSLAHASGSADWMVERARDACRTEAEDRRYRVLNVSDERNDQYQVRLNMELSRRGDDYFARCYFENGRAELDIESD